MFSTPLSLSLSRASRRFRRHDDTPGLALGGRTAAFDLPTHGYLNCGILECVSELDPGGILPHTVFLERDIRVTSKYL